MTMSKVNFCVVICLFALSSFSMANVLRSSYVKALRNNRRISPFRRDGFLLSGLYNKEGRPNEVGADFGLTSDVYTKPNPYYNKIANKKPQTDYSPVYNHSAGGHDASGSVTEEVYDTPSYDYKSNGYPSPSYGEPPTSNDLASYNVQSVPSHGYGLPSPHYSAGTNSYYPQTSYGSSQQTYNSPHTSYSSHETPNSGYGAPSYYPTSTAMGGKYPDDQKSHGGGIIGGLIGKMLKKFDLILMSKILLKLIIFKKIVKFIGIICLLMFLPILKKKWSGDDDEEERRIKPLDDFANLDFRVKEIMNFAFTSLEGFSINNIPWCVGESFFYCRLQYMLDQIDNRYPGARLLEIWFPKLQTTTVASTTNEDELRTTSTQRTFDEGTVDFNDFITESSDESKHSSEENSNENKLEEFNKIFRR